MTKPAHQPGTFRTGPLMGQVIAACVAGGLGGAGMAYAAGWGRGDLQAIALAAFVSTFVWTMGAVLGVLLLGVNSQNQTAKLAPGVLASSTARMMVALFVGVLLYFLLNLEGRTFWTAFLLAGLFGLFAETTWAIRTINASRPQGAEAGVS